MPRTRSFAWAELVVCKNARPGHAGNPSAEQTSRLARRVAHELSAAGWRLERVLSDNGNGYRSFAWRDTCAELGIQRRYTRPRRPQTNGKGEALIKTLQREWAYRFAYHSSTHRARALSDYLRWYN